MKVERNGVVARTRQLRIVSGASDWWQPTLEQAIDAEVEAGVALAESSADPNPQESTFHVYTEE